MGDPATATAIIAGTGLGYNILGPKPSQVGEVPEGAQPAGGGQQQTQIASPYQQPGTPVTPPTFTQSNPFMAGQPAMGANPFMIGGR